MNCLQKLEFRKLYPGQGQTRSVNADVGKALHAGHQHWMVHQDRERAIAEMMLRYPIDLENNPMKPRSVEACYATMNCVMDNVKLDEYEIAQIECKDGVVRPAIEVPFRIKLKDVFLDKAKTIPFEYIGFIDAILFHRMTGRYLTTDIKTHRNNAYDLSPLYVFSEQQIPYGICLEAVLGKRVEEFDVMYISVYVDILEPSVRCYTFTKTQNDLGEWMLNLAMDIQTYQQCYELEFWPRNGESCMKFGDKCSHIDYCGTRDRETRMAMMFVDGTEPYEREEIVPWIEFELDVA